MKKVYIEPKCKLLALSEEESLMAGSEISGGGNGTPGDTGESREVIQAPDPWEEW
jgi:hypothetical protein